MTSAGSCVYLGLVSVLALGIVGVRGQCARGCVTTSFGPNFDIFGEDGSLSIQSGFDKASQLDAFCGKKDTVANCMASCRGESERFIHDVVTRMMNYICGPGKSAVLSESECWHNPEYKEMTRVFSQDLVATMQERVKLVRTGQASSDLLCRTLDEFTNRIVSDVQGLCGKVAADFVRNLFQVANQPSRAHLFCD